jgi:hypothetical protein
MGNSISLEESDDNDERGHENNIEMKVTSLDKNDSIENSRENSSSDRSDTSGAITTIKKTKKMLSDVSVSKKRRSTSKNGAANNASAYRKTKSRRR